jgi:hypothetical protein
MRRKKAVQNLVVLTLLVVIVVFGALPILTRDASFYDRFGASDKGYDVVVLGMEPEGIAAALAAAQTGMRVLLLSPQPDPSSYLTDCLIQSMPHQVGRVGEQWQSLSGPAFQRLFGQVESTFSSAEWLRGIHALLLKESGLEVLFEATLTNVHTAGGRVSAVDVYAAGGVQTVKGRVFIDASEDALLLDQLGVPYLVGSEDLGAPTFFEPVSFHFRLLGVNWEDLRTISKVKDLSAAFSDALFLYPRTRDDVKLLQPTLIRQDEEAVVVSGLRLGFVNPDNPAEVAAAWQNGLREAMHMTAYLQTELVAFKDATWDVPAARLFVPEYRHYKGMETLSVSDILNNRDRRDKVAVLSDPVSANRFLRGDDPAILCDPNAYAVPIGCLVPEGWDNVLMPGRNASYASLASTSAATPSARTVVGEGAGLAAAWCVLENTDPAEVPALSNERLAEFVSFLTRAGQVLPDFAEPVRQPDGSALADWWMAEDVETLVSLGVLMGGVDNDFRLAEQCSGQVLATLAKNTLIRLYPEGYDLDLETRLSPWQNEAAIPKEEAARLLLALANLPADGVRPHEVLFNWLSEQGDWQAPEPLAQSWSEAGLTSNPQATAGELYHLVLAVCRALS